jgi:hypothetical protein
MKRRAVIILTCAAVGFAYLAAPIFAGANAVGARRGPILYPAGLHSTLYIIGYESTHDHKPRESITSELYYRSIFYFFPERPRSKDDREEIMNRLRQRHRPESGYLKEIERHNNELNEK